MSAELHPKIPLFFGSNLECTAVSTTATVAALIQVPFKCEILDFKITVRGSSTHSTAPTWALARRNTAGLTTQTELATVVKSATVNQQGKMLFATVMRTGTFTALPGHQLSLAVRVSSGDSLAYDACVVVRELPETPANMTTQMTGS